MSCMPSNLANYILFADLTAAKAGFGLKKLFKQASLVNIDNGMSLLQ